uniref:NADH dehydrogenase subunit 6 n=1 Tax=Teredorus bashanensis TaxID=2936563 RepID=A0A8T9VVU1_9ORTH|nr:NADH dehydrogenase subunit 6 [Teredorus bashanensis]UPH84314.1 NADH dehydrogenase subunit 6 [Teredorus bashanensis]
MKLIMITSMMMNSIFMHTKQPMNMIIITLMQTTMMMYMMSMKSLSSWFNYLLMIIFVGGMMVLFIYITSVAPNEKTKISKKMIPTFMMMTMITLMLNNESMINEKTSLMMNINENTTYQIMLNKMFNKPMYYLSITMMMYLFIALIAVNKITNLTKGPLRKSN